MRARLLLLPSLLLVAACTGSSSEPPSGAPCEIDPELSLTPAGYRSNGASLNGQNLNGQNLNGQNLNGRLLNGQSVNGLALNGQNLNGQNLNGQNLNGQNLNGQNLNGQNLNGIRLNGASGYMLRGVAANELVARTADGRDVAGAALVGVRLPGVLSTGETIELAVTAFDRSADGTIALYSLTYEGRDICPNGEKGMFVPGVWDSRAARHDWMTVAGNVIDASFSCAGGAIAKCVTWGYTPWGVGADVHQACTRMARADYCGTGISYTKEATTIDVFDARGVQKPTDDATFAFEAGWGPDGAVCASRTRFDARTPAGGAKMPSCWSTLPRCGSLDEAVARGATIANASRPQSRVVCE